MSDLSSSRSKLLSASNIKMEADIVCEEADIGFEEADIDYEESDFDYEELLRFLTTTRQASKETICPCRQQSCIHSPDSLDAAETLLLLSERPRKMSEDELDAAKGLLMLALPTKQQETETASRNSFEEYRQKALGDLKASYGGNIVINNPNMSRKFSGISAPHDSAQMEKYRQYRIKNNRSAKKSRDRQRMKRIENNIKCNYYEQDNQLCEKQLSQATIDVKMLSIELEFAVKHLQSHQKSLLM